MTKAGRRLASKVKQLNIILEQQCRCAYCNRPLLGLDVHWDHITPYSYKQKTIDNWAASCKECNLAKSSKFFNEESMTDFIIKRMNWSEDYGDGSPDGHGEYWKRALHTEPWSSTGQKMQSEYDEMRATR